MKTQTAKSTRKASAALFLAVLLLLPVSVIVSADDTTPPVISNITYEPHIGVRTQITYFYWQCTVTDNVAVADVRLCLEGPAGFTPINDTMFPSGGNNYYYFLMSVPVSGTYQFTVFAKDTSGNSIRSASYPILVFESKLSTVHLDDSNVAGPWLGTEAYPVRYLQDALFIVDTAGTILVHEGQYNISMAALPSQVHIIGENQATCIIDGGATPQYVLNGNAVSYVTLANLTIRNGNTGLLLQGGSHSTLSQCTFTMLTNKALMFNTYYNSTVTECTFQDSSIGINLGASRYNTFYHNNFINIVKPVTASAPATNNVWDDGVTGNYWCDYRSKYPTAQIDPVTGTWTTPYLVNATGNNIDNHPWVYPGGVIDTTAPTVTVDYPNGGEVVSGEIAILWTATDDMSAASNTDIMIEFSGDAGASWQTIASGLSNTGSYTWNTTTVADSTDCLIKIYAADEFLNNASDVSDAVFEIFNNPNQPPATPDQPTGPTSGYTGVQYTYTTNPVTDPNGDTVSYCFDWDDGTNSSWLSTPSASHIWTAVGTYDVKVKAKDTYGAESGWSPALTVGITEPPAAPELVIDSITGGLGITAVIKNNGTVPADLVNWSIAVDGGFLLIGKTTSGQVETIAPGETATVKAFVLGFGLQSTITVTATCVDSSAEKTASGMVLLFFVLNVA
ncbi:MAG: right-handed parallel beta-helix repeat-containing protein [Candidatus Thermoplasmatota archaeon]|nr:right-handed parallel beta-helix repeat-containing protein [Candidatus Thermoplasmatota archaeon]